MALKIWRHVAERSRTEETPGTKSERERAREHLDLLKRQRPLSIAHQKIWLESNLKLMHWHSRFCVPFCLFMMPCSAIIFLGSCFYFLLLLRVSPALVCSVTFYFATICINLSSLNIRIHTLGRTVVVFSTSTTSYGTKIAQNRCFLSILFSTRWFFFFPLVLLYSKMAKCNDFRVRVQWCECKEAAAAVTTIGNKQYACPASSEQMNKPSNIYSNVFFLRCLWKCKARS